MLTIGLVKDHTCAIDGLLFFDHLVKFTKVDIIKGNEK
jgi:hypothetical protein